MADRIEDLSIEELMKLQVPTTREGLHNNILKPEAAATVRNPFITKDTRVGFIKDQLAWQKNNDYIAFAGELWREGFHEAATMFGDMAHISFITSGSLDGAQQNAIISERTDLTSNTFENKKPAKPSPIDKLKDFKW